MTDISVPKPIKLAGRLDTARVGEIETGFYASVGAFKTRGEVVLIDLTDVEFLSSLGIRLLITAGKLLKQRQMKVGVIAPASSQVMEALELSGLSDFFSFFDSEATARAALA
ncbi:MAG TPA: STAS domain-containing protein [Parvibaculum sp.]